MCQPEPGNCHPKPPRLRLLTALGHPHHLFCLIIHLLILHKPTESFTKQEYSTICKSNFRPISLLQRCLNPILKLTSSCKMEIGNLKKSRTKPVELYNQGTLMQWCHHCIVSFVTVKYLMKIVYPSLLNVCLNILFLALSPSLLSPSC